MNISQEGIDLIKSFEGCILQSYDDYNDKIINAGDTVRGTLTIGWGLTSADINVYKGMKITQEEADNMFLQHLQKYIDDVNNLGREWTQNEFDALVSFNYNTGSVYTLTNGRDKTTIVKKMAEYVYSNGKVYQGLVRRRQAEIAMFLGSGNIGLTNTCSSSGNDVIRQLQHQINVQGFGNITEDGIFGNETLSHLPILRKGANGEITKWLQLRIGAVPDGCFGNNTENSVKYMQHKWGLEEDGIVGRNTWNVICKNEV